MMRPKARNPQGLGLWPWSYGTLAWGLVALGPQLLGLVCGSTVEPRWGSCGPLAVTPLSRVAALGPQPQPG